MKLGTKSYIESIFVKKPVASFLSSLLDIPLEEAKAIHNIDDFDRQLLRIQQELDNNENTLISQKKFEFLFRYYSATNSYKNHFSKFQEMLIIQLKSRSLIHTEVEEANAKGGNTFGAVRIN